MSMGYVCVVCMHMYVQVCVPTYASGIILYLTLPHFFETGSLTKPEAHDISKIGQPVILRDLLVSAPRVLRS